ncbi:MAG TPA: Rne/Rng family ribonuclease [Acidobacteriaceae bacterium]|nr:Rne/Rng family ribonuclease [Acidobacteriaceae bacterium]
MTKEIYISSTPHETRLAVVEDEQLAEIYYERENEYTLAGSVYKGKVTRVLPGMQSAFVDIGLERDAFLYVTDFAEESEDGEEYIALTPGQPSGRSLPAGGSNGHSSEPASNDSHRHQQGAEPTRRDDTTPGPPRSSSEATSSPAQGEPGTGSKRWRGRRGRRRGRSNGAPQNVSGRPAEPIYEHGGSLHQESDLSVPESAVSEPDADRPEHFESTLNQPQTPHTEPTSAMPRQHSEPSSQASALVLPGESLSKYRTGSTGSQAPASASATPTTTAPVSNYQPPTMVTGALAWDGSDVLPGESLSRYKNKPAHESERQKEPESSVPSASIPASTQAEAGPIESPDSPAPRPEQETSPDPVPASEINPDFHPTRGESSSSEPALALAEAQEQAALNTQETEEQATHSTIQEDHAAEQPEEFEPAEGSASYRVDPSAPSAYRQTIAPDSALAEPERPLHSLEESYPVTAPDRPEQTAAALEYKTERAPEPNVVPEPFLGEAVSIAPHSAPSSTAATELPESQSPVAQHSGSEVVAESSAVEPEERGESLDSDEGDHTSHPFDPGLGHLEEEMIDEEEAEAFAAQTLLDETEYDDLVEETLDVQMDSGLLSELVRDQHIDKRTRFVEQPGIEGHGEPAMLEEEEDLDAGKDSEEEMFEGSLAGLELETISDTSAEDEADGSAPARNGRPDSQRGHRRGMRGQQRPGQRGDRGRMRRATAQTSNLPAITELLKPNQEILVQIAKEPIARKGARITSHIALPGRFLVFMPTVNHVGVSRKISSDEERQRLKRILLSEKGAASGGFIVRTAAASASEDDLRADIRFLLTLWGEMRQRAENSKPPALIYHDLSLVERVLRDQVTDNFSAIWVDSEADYERVLRFLSRFEPSLVRRVKLYTKETPLFEQFGIQEEINKALRSKVWLKSGGSIVINQTEALVAIDINTGKYVGKTARLEDTILKTNLDAIPEIVRQIRLRDLGGIIVIDFIDMDERKNRNKVMQALEDELKSDRAPSKVLQFNDFGLVAITRKRVKQSLERTLSVPCSVCSGTGMVKGPLTVCNEIYIELRKMHRQFDRSDVMLRVHPEVVKQLKASNGRWLAEMEEMSAKTIIVKSDAALHPEQFDIH